MDTVARPLLLLFFIVISGGILGIAKGQATGQGAWCVAKPSTTEIELKNNIEYACSFVNCNMIQSGGTCFEPQTLISHASVAMNLYYQKQRRNFWNCNFTNSGIISVTDPSYADCNDTKEGDSKGEDVGLKNFSIFEEESDVEEIPETKFEEDLYKPNMEEVSVGQKDKRSEDPFNIYDLLNKKEDDNYKDHRSENSLKNPPGFTPTGAIEERFKKNDESKKESDKYSHRCHEDEVEIGIKDNCSNKGSKEDAAESVCSGHFKKSEIPRTCGYILQLMDDLVKVGQTMGYNMEGCMKNMEEIIESQGLAQKAKKDWVKELCVKNKVNFLSLQETKMEDIELFSVKMSWGNFAFDYIHSASVGNSGGILCVWDPSSFHKTSATVSDYFVMVRGVWVQNGNNLLIISVYAPQELTEKKMLWDYLAFVIDNWKGEVVIMGEFNEVRKKVERFGSVFNVQGANAFNLFICNAGLEEVPLGGCSFTWCHKSATKMSKLDRFLISESLMSSCPNISAITLDRYLSDHRPILLRESQFDYGPIPFRFFHYWLEMEGFDKLVEETWNEAPVDESNAMINMMKKLKYLKHKIRVWNNDKKKNARNSKTSLKEELADLDAVIDKGEGNVDVVNKRTDVVKSLQELEKLQSLEAAQKAKIKWAIEGDENSKYYHGILNKKRNQLTIRGILAEADLDIEVTKEEIKRAVWDCGVDKSPRPEGFTFGFYRHFWKVIENDVVDAVTYFFQQGIFPKGGNSSFIALIPKIPNAKMVKDFRPISLIGSLYKIIAKILANRLVVVLGDIVNEVQSAFIADRQILDGPFILNELFQWCKSKKKQSLIFKVDFEKAYDSVRWDFLDDVLKKFGFGERWCGWIQSCLRSSRGSIIVNGSPTEEFQFYQFCNSDSSFVNRWIGLKFLLVLLYISRKISTGGIFNLSFYVKVLVCQSLLQKKFTLLLKKFTLLLNKFTLLLLVSDSAARLSFTSLCSYHILKGFLHLLKWSDSNIDTIVHVLDCFYRASGMRINMSKSKLMGISVEEDKVDQAGSKVGGLMSRIQSWDEIVERVIARLSKLKMKMLSIGGRLTLLKSVLGSMPIYHMSIFKVPIRVLQRLESIRCHFFNGNDLHGKKPSWVKWKNVLASKEKGGLGVSSLYALNRALMFKWVWRFLTQSSSLWARVIKAIHGDDGKMGKNVKSGYPSIWLDIVHEMDLLKKQGIDVIKCINIKSGNGENTSFWEDVWRGDIAFKHMFPRMYALESCKSIDVASKLSHLSLDFSFRRVPRGGVEQEQFIALMAKVEGVFLVNRRDRWVWSLEGSGEFSVASVRKLIDDKTLPEVAAKTRGIKVVPIKVNVHAWKVRLDCLPTRINISRRGWTSTSHLFSLLCHSMLEEIFRKISDGGDLVGMEVSFVHEEWLAGL
ncbi:RNA-directed DNA polymerase, eukaryota, Reverse transcriptase zinc-binding domain protein [Artemisia annua]|uniref:RNA-directed DNA polymerase, eukaryota, Reverse transcriptase zinc-binding domain protein n=1 Tax=Artemisia annua TaxID=35608 RepID=A0A2U1PQ50_ARTAN|nr:RNA-directed DNA polymerase, eukaryota, Reverse transcriptase zinc-binding domain protein [Artemisia annua]